MVYLDRHDLMRVDVLRCGATNLAALTPGSVGLRRCGLRCVALSCFGLLSCVIGVHWFASLCSHESHEAGGTHEHVLSGCDLL